jgi:hypothetical protein
MAIAFNKFIARYYPGLRILNIANEEYLPGAILHSRSLRYLGHVRHLLKGPAKQYDVRMSEANMVYGEVSGGKSIKGGGGLLGLVSLSAEYSKEVSAEYSITDIRGGILPELPQIILQPRLQEIRLQDEASWKQVNNQFVVTEVYYANSFTVRFRRNGRIVGKAELDTHVNVSASASYSWLDSNALVITENGKVPFGVRGFKV